MIRAIIFDCFGVFYVDPVQEYVEDPHSPPDRVQALRDLDDLAALGRLDEEQWIAQAAPVLGLTPAETKRRFYGRSARNQKLLDFAEDLRTRYKIGMLSNVGRGTMSKYFTPTELAAFFDACILSYEVGVTKPNPEIFSIACEHLGIEPYEAIMIDDLAENCDGARAAGLQAIQYSSFTQTRRELEQLLANPKH